MSILVRIAKDDYATDVVESKFYNLDHESDNAIAPGEACGDCGIKTVNGITPPHCANCDSCYVAGGYQIIQCAILETRSDLKNPFLNLLERDAFINGRYCGKDMSKVYADIYKNLRDVSLKFNRYCAAIKNGTQPIGGLPSKEEFGQFMNNAALVRGATEKTLEHDRKAHLINKNEQCNVRDNLERANVLINAYRKLMNSELSKAEPEVEQDDMEVGG